MAPPAFRYADSSAEIIRLVITYDGGLRRSTNTAYRAAASQGARIITMSDPYELERFVVAQTNTYEAALTEIRRGAKRSHWIWYVFPQIAGLGTSAMSKHYAIRSSAEARAYLDHPMLGPRLRECIDALQDLTNTNAAAVFGDVDAMKLRSSLTLFIEAGAGSLFQAALDRWFDGQQDKATLDRLSKVG